MPQKTVYSVQHSPDKKINVVYFDNGITGKGLAVFVNADLQIKAYAPVGINEWFTSNSSANLPAWKSAYHTSGLSQESFLAPSPPVKTKADYMEFVPATAPHIARGSLHPAVHATMLHLFGEPGPRSATCDGIDNPRLLKRMKTVQVAPMLDVYGFDLFVDLLQQIFAEVKTKHPNLYPIVESAGCVCCRAVRGSESYWSNHSWGSAIDLKIGGILAPMTATRIPYGLIAIWEIASKYGVFWAQGYNNRTDPMHFEVAQETLLQWAAARRIF